MKFARARGSNRRGIKKPGGKNEFSSRVEVRGYDSEKISGVVSQRYALVPFSLCCFFLGSFFTLFGHRLFPPFAAQTRWVVWRFGM